MVNFLSSIIDFMAMIGDSVSNIITGLASMLGLIPQALTAINYVIGYIPGVLTVFATAGIAICVVFHIIGR